MKKLVMIAIMSLTMSACTENTSLERKTARDMTETMSIICLDGVQYWLGYWGTARVMSPRISPKTGGYIRCPKVQTTTGNIPVTQKISE